MSSGTSQACCLAYLVWQFKPLAWAGYRDGEKTLKRPASIGMQVYQIPGVSFGLPTEVGPTDFSLVFTSRHAAKISWVSGVAASICMHAQDAALRRLIQQRCVGTGVKGARGGGGGLIGGGVGEGWGGVGNL